MNNRPLRAAPDPEDFSDLYTRIDQPKAAQTNVESWRPQIDGPGSDVKGTVIAVSEVDGFEGRKDPVLLVNTTQGERKIWVSHAVLRRELENQPPQPGSRILIRYDGVAESKAGHEYHTYSVAVDPTLPVPNGQNWVAAFNDALNPVEDLPF